MSKQSVLSVGDAIVLGDLVNAIATGSHVRWLADSDDTIHAGTLRSFVAGPDNYGMPAWGTDVRDMHVWVTTFSGFETTFSVAHALRMRPLGGMSFDD